MLISQDAKLLINQYLFDKQNSEYLFGMVHFVFCGVCLENITYFRVFVIDLNSPNRTARKLLTERFAKCQP